MNVASRLGLEPRRDVLCLPNGTYQVTVTPPFSKKGNAVNLTSDQYRRYLQWRSSVLMIQDALPELPIDQREILMSGFNDEQFKALWKEDE